MTREMVPYTEDPKLERKYRNLERLGKELKIPTFRSFLTLEVFDSEGKPIHSQKQRSHSWNRNAYNYLFGHVAGYGLNPISATFAAGVHSLKAVSGDIYPNGSGWSLNKLPTLDQDDNLNTPSNDVGLLAQAGDSGKGIVVGTGTSAENFEGFALETPISNGSGAGQMDIAQSNNHSISYDIPSLTLSDTLVRYFNNNSGDSIVIGETGLYIDLIGSSFGQKPFMISRDVLASTVTVPNTGQLKVTYTIELVYPA